MDKMYIVYFALALIAVGACFFLWVKRKEVVEFLTAEDTKKLIKDYCVQAEKKIIDDTLNTKRGQERLDYVVNMMYGLFPAKLQKFVTREAIIKAVNEVFKRAAKQLENGHTVIE